jgi:hypothetical protein
LQAAGTHAAGHARLLDKLLDAKLKLLNPDSTPHIFQLHRSWKLLDAARRWKLHAFLTLEAARLSRRWKLHASVLEAARLRLQHGTVTSRGP